MKTPPYHQSPIDSFWNLSTLDAIGKVSSDAQGLSENNAQERLKQDGPNSLKVGAKISVVLLFLLQFKSPITLLLIAASVDLR